MKKLLLPLLFLVAATCLWSADEPETTPPRSEPVALPSAPQKSDPDEALVRHLQQQLDAIQFKVTMQCGTEPPFRNRYWNNKEPGVYLCIVSEKPLFLSTDKFDSGTGWPSFTRPIDPELIEEVHDTSHGMVRIEVRSIPGKSHLGHVFPDGPPPAGLRYCINSAALKFIPATQLREKGFPELAELFE